MFTNEIIYNVDNQICQLPLRFSFSLIYAVLCIYIIPLSMIVFIYSKLLRYIKQMNKLITPINNLTRAKRELIIVQRIVVLIIILFAAGFPYALFILMSFFNRAPKYHFRMAFFIYVHRISTHDDYFISIY